MHLSSIVGCLALALTTPLATAQATAQKVGWTGTLSSLDAGLGGTVVVVSPTALRIDNYKLADGSAPALYWWGSTSTNLKDGFRISNAQITGKATSNTLDIALDAGKTTADFMTVGLWCERFSANFGQAVLAAPAGGSGNATAGSSTSSGASPAGTSSSATSGAEGRNVVGWTAGMLGSAALIGAALL